MRRILMILGALVLGLGVTTAAAAKDYPRKPINVYCMFGPGGTTDLVLRIVAEYATNNGFTMNVINKPGGGGSQAALEVAKARPDGYSLFFASPSFITLSEMKNVGCTINDFESVAYVTEMYMSFNVLAESDIKSFGEWMDRAAKAPGTQTYGSPGSITSQRMLMTKLLKERFPNHHVPHVPYQSGHDVNTALLGNHIRAAFSVPGVCRPYVQSGQFRILAVSSPQRLPEYPEVPTFVELFGKDYEWASFNGFFAPKKTPKAIIDALAGVVDAALKDPAVLDKLAKIGMPAVYKNPEDSQKDVARMQKLIQESLKDMKL